MTEHTKNRAIRYATVLTRWCAVATLVFVATMTAGVYVTNHFLAKIYSATASVQLHATGETARVYSGWGISSPQSRAIEAELESIESPEILRAVISDLSLDKTWAERIFNRSDPLSTEEAQHYLESHLRLNFRHDSNVVEITALSDDPKEAAQIANEVVEMYKVTHDPRASAAAAPFAQDSESVVPAGGIKITSQAEVPFEPTAPNKRFCYGIAAALGGLLCVMIASSIEICLLIARAEVAAAEQQKLGR